MSLAAGIINHVFGLRPLKSFAVDDYITAVNCGFVNFFLYRRDGHTIAFDTGYNIQSTRRILHAIGVDPASVSHVFLSHSDFDHAGGLPVFNRALVYYAQTEVRKFARQSKKFRWAQRCLSSYALHDRESVNIGSIWVTALQIPGHTPGSLAYLVDSIYLLSGDTLSLKDGKAHINRHFCMDIKSIRQSANTLTQLKEVKVLLTPHWGYANYAEAFSDWDLLK